LGLLKELMEIKEFEALRLVGGTSLALQIGHRNSIDIDLFGHYDTSDEFALTELLSRFSNTKFLSGSKSINGFPIKK